MGIFSNSAEHTLRSVSTAPNPITCRLAQPLFSIDYWWADFSTPHLCIEANRPRFELGCTSLGNEAATPDLPSAQVLNSIYSACYALRLSALQLISRQRSLSLSFASKLDKFASPASRYLLRKLNIEGLFNSQVCVDIPLLRKSGAETQSIDVFPAVRDNTSRCTCILRRKCVKLFWQSLIYSFTTLCRSVT